MTPSNLPIGWLPSTLLDWLQVVFYIASFLGIIYAAIFFPANERKKRHNERTELLARANEPFRTMLELQMEYPNLKMESQDREFVVPQLDAASLTRQKLLFEYLFSITENVFILCDRGKLSRVEWEEWEVWFTEGYSGNPNFMHWWNLIDGREKASAYDPVFMTEIRRLIKKGQEFHRNVASQEMTE